MEPLAFVEVLRHGQVQHRVPITALPASLGRAYDNQVIIDDPFLAPHHARLERDEGGQLWLCTLSHDGLEVASRAPVSATLGLNCALGRTQIRVRSPGFVVPPARRERELQLGIERVLTRPGLTWAILFSALGVLLVRAYLGSTEDFLRSRSGAIVAAGVVLLVWSGLWAFGTRLVTHRFRYLGHLTAAASATALYLGLATVLSYVAFLFPASPLIPPLSLLLDGVGVGLFLLAHMLVAGVTSVSRLMWALVGGAVCIAALLALDESVTADGELPLPLSAELKPLPASAIPTREADSFFRDARRMQHRVDRAALEFP